MDDGFRQAHRSALWKAIVYIQHHLDAPLPLKRVADVAGYSPHHFHRLFTRFTGESVKAYIRRLRLEEAAFRIRVDRSQIIDVAMDSGYFTHETFSRAFHKRFGANPSLYRRTRPAEQSDIWIASVGKAWFGGRACIFKRHQGRYEESGLPEDAGSLWRQLIGRLPDQSRGLKAAELYGICRDDPSITAPEHIRYDACVAVPRTFTTHPQTCSIPKGFYVRAIHRGPFETLAASYHYLIHAWCPQYSQRVNPRIPPFEQFLMTGADGSERTQEIAIHIPVSASRPV